MIERFILVIRRWWCNRRIKAQVREITMALREGAKERYPGEGSRKVEGNFRLRVNSTDLGEINGLEIRSETSAPGDIAAARYLAAEVLRELAKQPREDLHGYGQGWEIPLEEVSLTGMDDSLQKRFP